MYNSKKSFFFSCLKTKTGSAKASGLPVDQFGTNFGPGKKWQVSPKHRTAFPQTYPRSALQNLQKHVQIVVELVVLGLERVDGLHGMNDRGVVTTAKGIADFRETV